MLKWQQQDLMWYFASNNTQRENSDLFRGGFETNNINWTHTSTHTVILSLTHHSVTRKSFKIIRIVFAGWGQQLCWWKGNRIWQIINNESKEYCFLEYQSHFLPLIVFPNGTLGVVHPEMKSFVRHTVNRTTTNKWTPCCCLLAPTLQFNMEKLSDTLMTLWTCRHGDFMLLPFLFGWKSLTIQFDN